MNTNELDFSIQNIPFGIISSASNSKKRVASAYGSNAIDLTLVKFNGPLLGNGVAEKVFNQCFLNDFMELGRPAWREARQTLQNLIKENKLPAESLISLSQVQNHLPAKIGDYTDFYASKEHATNVGTMFRGKDNALMPNWVHIPVGYHGRASSVVVTGTNLKRPSGLILDPTTKLPYYSKSKKMDIELEVAFLVGKGNNLGEPIKFDDSEDHIFGMVLMNDWSSRDIQSYEYVPLGPFLGKNFGTTVSPWVVTLDAMEPFRTSQPHQDPKPADYLTGSSVHNAGDAYDVNLQVYYKTPKSKDTLICESNLKYMYWTFKQQLAHHTVNGCNMNTGDLCGSGTISGPTENSFGSLLELTWNGSKSLNIDGEERKFLEYWY
ncbi:hypothetical protein HK099_000625 [Clydaea vesicula]|uniref:Fumarylacetoacetase n=1 Tax=Clydaea vesicula TaxID=447962 RepID=A0AAD5XSR8_9FUNG|nr:hypothetical protein HK099_000625 [Clydaea vesicula]